MTVEARYDPVANPYAPGAGTPPPTLVGRDETLDAARISLERAASGRSAQHLLVTGLRGVGKTVLLRAVTGLAEQRRFLVLRTEATDPASTVASLVRQVRRLTDDLHRGRRLSRLLRLLDAVSLTVAGSGLRVERRSGDVATAGLAELMIELAGVAGDDERGVVLALDEGQFLPPPELGELLAALHQAGQEQVPLWGAIAGLPNVVGIVSRSRTYAERMFTVASLDALSAADVGRALRVPAEELGVRWSDGAVEAIAERSAGYPFFVQTWAYHAWNAASHDPIAVADVEAAQAVVARELDDGFFAARMARIPPSEVRYVQALASLGPGGHRSKAVAAAMGMTTTQVGPFRDRLITEGVLFAPAFGQVRFALPQLDDYVRRVLGPPAPR